MDLPLLEGAINTVAIQVVVGVDVEDFCSQLQAYSSDSVKLLGSAQSKWVAASTALVRFTRCGQHLVAGKALDDREYYPADSTSLGT